MRRGDAKPCRAARLTTTADDPPWSERALPARVPREAPFPNPSESEAFARVLARTGSSSAVWAREVLHRRAEAGLQAVRSRVGAHERDAEARRQRRSGIRPVLGAEGLELRCGGGEVDRAHGRGCVLLRLLGPRRGRPAVLHRQRPEDGDQRKRADHRDQTKGTAHSPRYRAMGRRA